MAIELATAYISIVPETKDLEAGIKKALNSASKNADTVGADIGSKMAAGASKSLKSGWRPDMDIMAGIPDTKAILKEGDIINVDVTVFYNGYHGDCRFEALNIRTRINAVKPA